MIGKCFAMFQRGHFARLLLAYQYRSGAVLRAEYKLLHEHKYLDELIKTVDETAQGEGEGDVDEEESGLSDVELLLPAVVVGVPADHNQQDQVDEDEEDSGGQQKLIAHHLVLEVLPGGAVQLDRVGEHIALLA